MIAACSDSELLHISYCISLQRITPKSESQYLSIGHSHAQLTAFHSSPVPVQEIVPSHRLAIESHVSPDGHVHELS